MSPGSPGGKSGKLVYVSARVRKSVRGRTVAGSGGTDGPRERVGPEGRQGRGGAGSRKAGMRSQTGHVYTGRHRSCGLFSKVTRPSTPPFLPPPWRASVTELSYQRSREPSRYVPKYASRPTNPELGSRERGGEGREKGRAAHGVAF